MEAAVAAGDDDLLEAALGAWNCVVVKRDAAAREGSGAVAGSELHGWMLVRNRAAAPAAADAQHQALAEPPPARDVLEVAARPLNVRGAASLSSAVVGVMLPGDQFVIEEEAPLTEGAHWYVRVRGRCDARGLAGWTTAFFDGEPLLRAEGAASAGPARAAALEQEWARLLSLRAAVDRQLDDVENELRRTSAPAGPGPVGDVPDLPTALAEPGTRKAALANFGRMSKGRWFGVAASASRFFGPPLTDASLSPHWMNGPW